MKNKMMAALIAVLTVSASTVWAADENEENGHFYVGTTTGYFKSSGDRGIGNTRTIGVVVGREFNENWSAEFNYFVDGGSPGKEDVLAEQINIIRHWGTDTRILVDFGFTDIKVDAMNSTFGYHVGAGLSAFLTNNLELRGDLKLMYFGADAASDWILSDRNEESYLEGMGTISLNWHFGRTGYVSHRSSSSVLGASQGSETLPPIQQREPIEAIEPMQPMVEEPVQQVTEAQSTVPAQPRSTHTLVNFSSNSIDLDAKYGAQLDQISSEIISTNSSAVVEGYSDSKGNEAFNKTLSMDRAIVVKRALKQRGVNGADIGVVGYGEENPVAPNDTAEGRAKNRRVEVKVYDKQ